MPETARTKTLEHWVHWSLLAGVFASGFLLGVGLLLNRTRGIAETEAEASSITALVHRAADGDGVAFMNLGLLVLMATPLLRVGVLGIGWYLNHERHFAVIALVVLLLLILSFSLGVG